MLAGRPRCRSRGTFAFSDPRPTPFRRHRQAVAGPVRRRCWPPVERSRERERNSDVVTGRAACRSAGARSSLHADLAAAMATSGRYRTSIWTSGRARSSAFIGPNGAGKSTSPEAACRLDPSHGRVRPSSRLGALAHGPNQARTCRRAHGTRAQRLGPTQPSARSGHPEGGHERRHRSDARARRA